MPLPQRLARMATVVKHFINLTNGIEALPALLEAGVAVESVGFLRLQSSHCEGALFKEILLYLDSSLLMHLSLGHCCLVYDYGSRGTKWPDGTEGVPRAVWWGLEWVRYAVSRAWNLPDFAEGANGQREVVIRGYNVSQTWDHEYRNLPRGVLKRLKYFRPYVRCRSLQLHGVFRATDLDGQTEEYRSTLHDAFGGGDSSSFSSIDRATSLKSAEQHLPAGHGLHVYESSRYDAVGRGAGRAQKKGVAVGAICGGGGGGGGGGGEGDDEEEEQGDQQSSALPAGAAAPPSVPPASAPPPRSALS